MPARGEGAASFLKINEADTEYSFCSPKDD